jgi:hypothetical protein
MLKTNITNYMTKRYGDILGLSGMQKQSQTKPILPACMAGKIALSEAEEPIKKHLSAYSADKIALPALECRYRGILSKGLLKLLPTPPQSAIFYHCASMYGPIGPFGIGSLSKTGVENQPRDLWKRRELIVRMAIPIMSRTTI